MNKIVKLNLLMYDQIEERVECINMVSDNISKYQNDRIHNKFNCDAFEELILEIRMVLKSWVGNTYIGKVKEDPLKNSFQNFFVNLMKLMIEFKDNSNASFMEKQMANECLYRGKIYRYLGHSTSKRSNQKISPEYNNIYVSWSKLSKVSYIESKLRGFMTIIEIDIVAPFYGIDLEGLRVSNTCEREVVFPTIENLVKNIEYRK